MCDRLSPSRAQTAPLPHCPVLAHPHLRIETRHHHRHRGTIAAAYFKAKDTVRAAVGQPRPRDVSRLQALEQELDVLNKSFLYLEVTRPGPSPTTVAVLSAPRLHPLVSARSPCLRFEPRGWGSCHDWRRRGSRGPPSSQAICWRVVQLREDS